MLCSSARYGIGKQIPLRTFQFFGERDPFGDLGRKLSVDPPFNLANGEHGVAHGFGPPVRTSI
ncbi:MAG TPA: hypothetical protein VII30_08320 [Gemmatimonadaceae bacterium]